MNPELQHHIPAPQVTAEAYQGTVYGSANALGSETPEAVEAIGVQVEVTRTTPKENVAIGMAALDEKYAGQQLVHFNHDAYRAARTAQVASAYQTHQESALKALDLSFEDEDDKVEANA